MKKFHTYLKTAIPAIVYMIVYLTWFRILEEIPRKDYSIIHMKIDDKIPFCEFFIIPYLFWFFYVAWIIIYLFFKNKDDYRKCCIFLFSGMTIFLVVSTLFPNIQYLRPATMPRENIFSTLVAHLYKIDTCTNIWPSIHVYNSLGVYFAVVNNSHLGNKKWIRTTCCALTLSIVLSTIFLKQHSMFDVMTAFILAALFYVVTYRMDILTYLKRIYFSYQNGKQKSRRYIN